MTRYNVSRSAILIFAVVTFLALWVSGCSQQQTQDPAPVQTPKAVTAGQVKPASRAPQPDKEVKKLTKIDIAYSAIAGTQAPVWITKEKGLFEKYGLDVDLQYIATSTTLTQALLSGEIQLAQTGGNPVVTANIAGGDLIIIAVNGPVIGYTLFGQPDIHRIEDLKGKTVGITRFGSNTDFAARRTLKKFGLEPDKDVIIVEAGGVPETMAAMLAGGIQGTVTGPPNSLTLRKAGMRELVNIANLQIPYIQTCVAVSREYLTNNRATVSNFMKAFLEGIAVAKKDKAFAMKVISQYTRTDDKEVLDETYEFYVNRLLPKIPYASAEQVKTILDELSKTNAKARVAKPEAFLDNSVLKGLEDSGFVNRLYAR
ncbi:MAG: ABC transporter substrate-binding protein [Chloroflexi bacterium]|nr:ABC transporter substrate-binding protein [Chloroflexota bacterium]